MCTYRSQTPQLSLLPIFPLGNHKPVFIVPTDGHEFEQVPGDSDGQGSLACCSPWGCKESDTTERLN